MEKPAIEMAMTESGDIDIVGVFIEGVSEAVRELKQIGKKVFEITLFKTSTGYRS